MSKYFNSCHLKKQIKKKKRKVFSRPVDSHCDRSTKGDNYVKNCVQCLTTSVETAHHAMGVLFSRCIYNVRYNQAWHPVD